VHITLTKLPRIILLIFGDNISMPLLSSL